MNRKPMLFLAGILAVVTQAAQGWWYPPPQGPGYYGYGTGRPARAPSIDVSTRREGDHYVVTILLNGYQPSDLEITRWGRWLNVQRAASSEDKTTEPGAYSYSYSYGTLSRRISLPQDADLDQMVREDGEGVIRLTIPRRYW